MAIGKAHERYDVGYEIARQELPDLIALDLSTSFGNAWTICRLLRADPKTSGIPVVVLAGHEGSQMAAHARFAGVRAVVAGPLSVDALGLAVRNALA